MNHLYRLRVTVSTERVIDTLRKNLSRHRGDLEKLWLAYGRAMQKWADEVAAIVERDAPGCAGPIKLPTQPDAPFSYVDEYESAIRMLGHHAPATLEVSTEQAAAWLEDEWDWTRQFALAKQSYGVA